MLASIHLSPFATNQSAEQEQKVTIFDIIADNTFDLECRPSKQTYNLELSFNKNQITFDIQTTDKKPVITHDFDLTPLYPVLEDYALICESYKNAARTLSSEQVETIDMGRRGIHNQGAELLLECLRAHIIMDNETARRFFTLISIHVNEV